MDGGKGRRRAPGRKVSLGDVRKLSVSGGTSRRVGNSCFAPLMGVNGCVGGDRKAERGCKTEGSNGG